MTDVEANARWAGATVPTPRDRPSPSLAIAALAAGLCDWVVAPCCTYLLGGLPLVAAERTLSAVAMLAARRGRRSPLVRAAAGLQAVLHYLPARLTAALLIAAAPVAGTSPARAVRIARRERRRLAGPNDGWPIAAMAAALDICLEQRGRYRLNPGARPAAPADLARAQRLAAAALILWSVGIGAVTRAHLAKGAVICHRAR